MFHRLFGGGTLVPKVHKGRQHIFFHGRRRRGSLRRDGKLVELVAQFQHHEFECFFADAGYLRKRRPIIASDSRDHALSSDTVEYSDGELGPDTTSTEKFLKKPL